MKHTHIILSLFALALLVPLVSAAEYQPADAPLLTRWAKDLDPANVWSEYPRPTLQRQQWQNLNGLWDYAIRPADQKDPPQNYDGKILVPFASEAALSGIGKRVGPDNRLWYRLKFSVPAAWHDRNLLLNFDAVDWDATVWVNGQLVGYHRGGYDPFSFDISKYLRGAAEQELIVSVWDPIDQGLQPRGKQVQNPRGIWYTPVTGIWQTVWLEPVTEAHIQSLRITPDVDASQASVLVYGTDEADVHVEILDDGKRVASADGVTSHPIHLSLDDPKLWSPDSPFLYDVVVTLKKGRQTDRVESYLGMRKIEIRKDDSGIYRLFLNNEALFQYGPLDQGWWPDGLYTPPSDQAMKYDLEVLKKLGFNMLRKHVKVEPARLYYWCDKIGLLVWQDMPSTSGELQWIRDPRREGPDMIRDAESTAQFRYELQQMIDTLYNHPSIVMWVPFNERWGQFDTEAIVNYVRQLDPSRLVNEASGGNFRDIGDVVDIHDYPGPAIPPLDSHRAVILGEFGGLGLPLPGHTWQGEKNWGYRSFETNDALQAAYLGLMDKLEPLIAQGLAAAVYTQTTDVEIEVNGLLTYDREVLKMDADALRAAHERLYLPTPSMKVVLPNAQYGRAQRWRYTTSRPADNWTAPDFNDRDWQQGPAGFGTENTPGARVGTPWTSSDIWLRQRFNLDSTDFDRLYLSIHHDDDARVYINGQLVADLDRWTTGYGLEKLSPQARQALRRGANILAVHCHQDAGDQYIDVGLIEVSSD